MKKKALIYITVLLLSAIIFLPTITARIAPLVTFAGIVSGSALVVFEPQSLGAPLPELITTGQGSLSIRGQAPLPPGTIELVAVLQGIMLRDNKLNVAFDNQNINVRFMADSNSMGVFYDFPPLNDAFWLGIEPLHFSGTYKNGTGTYRISGNALIYAFPFDLGQPQPTWALLVLLIRSDGALIAQIIWTAETIPISLGETTTVTLPLSPIFGHSVQFRLT